MTRKTKRFISAHLAELIRNLPRCSRCDQLVGSITDKSKDSELVEWIGTHWTEAQPQFMWMFPSYGFPNLCHLCEYQLHPPQVGRES